MKTSLSTLNTELNEAVANKRVLMKKYNNEINMVDNEINRIKASIDSLMSLGNSNEYNSMKNAVNAIYPLNYFTDLKALIKTLSNDPMMYLKEFKKMLVKTLDKNTVSNDSNDLLKSDLQLQDNSYGGDSTLYTRMVRKGYETNYHPCLGGLSVIDSASTDQLEDLLLVVSRILDEGKVQLDDIQVIDNSTTYNCTVDKYSLNFLRLLFNKVNFNKLLDGDMYCQVENNHEFYLNLKVVQVTKSTI